MPDISNLPLTKTEKRIVEEYKKINFQKDDNYTIYKTFENIPLESVLMYSTQNSKVVEYYLENLRGIKLAISGKDLESIGISPSKEYKKCFEYILKKKINNPTLKLEDEICIAKEYFKI